MFEEITITNKTMELADCKNQWFFDEKFQCWCLEDILYTDKATTPKFQRLSIFVPKAYMSAPGEISDNGEMNGYTAKTVPVIFENNSAGYMQMPHVWLEGPRCFAHQYLEQGYVYVTVGNRGRESRDAKGELCGKSPINLIDLKTAIRFLRHNAKALPGDYNRMISVGWSAGGAMSALLAVTGNNEQFNAYLKENGAFMDESDAVYASQIYCPIIDLEHADLAYEWMFHEDKENEASPAGPAGIMNPFQEALSAKLKEKYITYFNSLNLVHPETGEKIELHENGRSGSAYDYLMDKLNESATTFLKKLERKELPETYSVEEYLTGNYEHEVPAPMGKADDDKKPNMMQGHAGPGVALRDLDDGPKDKKMPMEPPSLGDLVSRPPKGVPFHGFKPPMMMVQGKEKRAWLSWDGEQAKISDLDTYVLKHRRRMKPCTSFDTLGMDSGENAVFGTKEENYMHFNTAIADAIEELKEEFPAEYEKYYASFAKAKDNVELEKRKYYINPLNFIGTSEKSDWAKACRIRVGASDADTSLSVSMTLALKLSEYGMPVDYQLVWDKPHCEADYTGDVIEWIESLR
ncbi:MAG: prolyl oligopeptidase family serine peptidase [Agathobacter sp.]|nr:prolyl oligopeptidase family serine peptidase [Agathobacter sp.]